MTDDPMLPDDLFDDDALPTGDAGDPLPEAWLAVARAYHQPPSPAPVSSIEAAVAARTGRSSVSRDRARPWRQRPALAIGMGLAATLVIGVAIGRSIGVGPRAMSRSGGAVLADASTTTDTGHPSPLAREAAREHFARSEALLTAFRAEAASGRLSADLGPWARDLLSSTRLLLDSPVAREARERVILEELELLLMAVVQASASQRRTDTELLTQQMRRQNVLSRLRVISSEGAAVPQPTTE